MTTNKYRSYCIVIHNVQQDCQTKIENHYSSATKVVSSIEPYPENETQFHAHVFVSFSNPRSFRSVLNSSIQFARTITTPKPTGEERDWGRVQCDQMRGTFAEATSYLQGATKDKPIGKISTKGKYDCIICGRDCRHDHFIQSYTGLNVCMACPWRVKEVHDRLRTTNAIIERSKLMASYDPNYTLNDIGVMNSYFKNVKIISGMKNITLPRIEKHLDIRGCFKK